jgi:hypothetical protein
MYIESKTEGPERSGTHRPGDIFEDLALDLLQERHSLEAKAFGKANFDVDTHEEYWISGPRHDGSDRLYKSNLPIEIDEDVREEYWTTIRKKPEYKDRTRT